MNYVVTYGCPPNKGTPAKSTISLAYFENLRRKAQDYTGEVTIPDALFRWQGTDGQAETFTKFRQSIKLKYKNWVRPAGAVELSADGRMGTDGCLLQEVEQLVRNLNRKEEEK